MARRKRKNDGKEFEVLFGEYMQEQGFKVGQNEPCRGEQTARPYDCDLHGVRVSPSHQMIGRAGFGVFALFLGSLLFPENLGGVQRAAESAVATFAPSLVQYALAFLGGGAWLAWALGKEGATRHVWVECKNRQTSIKRTDINKLQSSVEDVRANSQATWKPNEVWFASTSDYDHDALNAARGHGIRCFQVTDGEAFEVSTAA